LTITFAALDPAIRFVAAEEGARVKPGQGEFLSSERSRSAGIAGIAVA
jgi:hypothetical protein